MLRNFKHTFGNLFAGSRYRCHSNEIFQSLLRNTVHTVSPLTRLFLIKRCKKKFLQIARSNSYESESEQRTIEFLLNRTLQTMDGIFVFRCSFASVIEEVATLRSTLIRGVVPSVNHSGFRASFRSQEFPLSSRRPREARFWLWVVRISNANEPTKWLSAKRIRFNSIRHQSRALMYKNIYTYFFFQYIGHIYNNKLNYRSCCNKLNYCHWIAMFY